MRVYSVYSIFFINGLHDRLMQHGGCHILRPLGKYFANDSIVDERTPYPVMKKPTSAIVELVSTITREYTRVLVKRVPRVGSP